MGCHKPPSEPGVPGLFLGIDSKRMVPTFETMEPQPVPQRWSGPLAMLEKGHVYLEKGNRSATVKILSGLQTQPFFEKEVQVLEQKLLNLKDSAALAGTSVEGT